MKLADVINALAQRKAKYAELRDDAIEAAAEAARDASRKVDAATTQALQLTLNRAADNLGMLREGAEQARLKIDGVLGAKTAAFAAYIDGALAEIDLMVADDGVFDEYSASALIDAAQVHPDDTLEDALAEEATRGNLERFHPIDDKGADG